MHVWIYNFSILILVLYIFIQFSDLYHSHSHLSNILVKKNFLTLFSGCTSYEILFPAPLHIWRWCRNEKKEEKSWNIYNCRTTLKDFFQEFCEYTPPNFRICARWKVQAKCFHHCNIRWKRKLPFTFSISFYFIIFS